MCKLSVIFLLVLCAGIHSLDVQNDQQNSKQTDKNVKEQNAGATGTIPLKENVPINPNQQNSIPADKNIKDQKVQASDTVVPNEKVSTNPNPNPQPTENVKKTNPKVTNEQIQILADQVLAIHGVKEGEDDPENLKKAAHLTKVVENVVKNLENKVKEKVQGENSNAPVQAEPKTENLNTDQKKAGVPQEGVSITKEAEGKPKLEASTIEKPSESKNKPEDLGKETVGVKSPQSKVAAAESIKNEENIEKNRKIEETLKKPEEKPKLQENVNEEIPKSEDINKDKIEIVLQETKADDVETIKIEIKPEEEEEIYNEGIEDNVVEISGKQNAEENVQAIEIEAIKKETEEKQNEYEDEDVLEKLEEHKDAIEEEVIIVEETGYLTLIVDFIYDKFLRN